MLASLMSACGGGGSQQFIAPGSVPAINNTAPTVEAGPATTVEERSPLGLLAVAADSDGQIAQVSWEQISGPPITLSRATTLSPGLIAPAVRETTALTFRISVQDNAGASASDEVTITVTPIPEAPVIQRVRVDAPSRQGVPLTVWVEDPDNDPVQLAVEYSPDAGATWTPARIDVLNETLPADAGAVTLRWRGLEDIGFRNPGPVSVRITPRAPDLPGSPWLETLNVDNLAAAAAAVQQYAAYYGPLTRAQIQMLQRYDLAIVHPFPNSEAGFVQREQIATIQDGVNPADPLDDVIVLCYVAVGEDLRTVSVSDEQLAADPRFTDTLSAERGPRVDPRGVAAYTSSLPLSEIAPLGLPSPGGTAFRSYYLDDASLSRGVADGIPDRNSVFGGAFVNAGDPAWFEEVNNMASVRGEPPGLREILTTDFGLGLGCDGVLLDAVDTAAPNTFSADSKFEWTAPGFADFVTRAKVAHPRALFLQNRGLFFFHPDLPHFAYSAELKLDFLLFESYRLDSQTTAEFSPAFFCDNKRNYMPKIVAKAQASGIRVLSLGYAEGPSDPVSGATMKDTLLGNGNYGFDSLMADIREARDIGGFAHYLTSADLGLLNDFVRRNVTQEDNLAPRWSSTYNDKPCDADVDAELLPTPRIGLQRVTGVPGGVRLEWDVALDPSSVTYVLYYQKQPFDLDRPDALTTAQKTALVPTMHRDYNLVSGEARLALEATVLGLDAEPYYFLLRARDESSIRNEDDNRNVLTAEPLP